MDTDLLQPGWRESIKRINGVDLHVVEAGDPSAPLLMLLHGFPEFWWAWRHQITPLAEAGYHVVVPDQRGYNLSSAPREIGSYGLDTLAGDVLALADSYDASRFYLVGHDWGAVVAWWVATRSAHRIERLVVLDGPHPDVLGKQIRSHPSQAVRSAYIVFFQLPVVPETVLSAGNYRALRSSMSSSANKGTFQPSSLDRYAKAWAHLGSLTGMLNYYRALRNRGTTSPPARVTPRTLILWGGNDSFLEQSVAEASLAMCDYGRLLVVEGATHWLHLEEPQRITAEILDFMSEVRGKSSNF